MMGRGAINLFGRGESREVRTAFDEQSQQCQACGACAFICPTGAVDLATITARRMQPHVTGFDKHLTARPCIDLAHPQASPRVPVIDRDNCIHFTTGECGLCAKVCQAGAIDYDQPAEKLELDVGAVVLTPGFEAFDAARRGEFGFGLAPNVLTSVQFERMLSASGPTQGHVRRPADGKAPRRLAFIQCVGSRDHGCDNAYCSSICCMAATKEAILAKEHEPGLDVTIFFLDLRAFGKDFDRYCDRAKNQLGVRYVRSFISRVYEMPGTRNLRLVHASPEMKQTEEEFDMVVLSLGLEPSASLQEQAQRLGVVLNRWGFAATDEFRPLDTSRPGVFVGGAFQEPKDIPDTVMQASAAAARAMALLAKARGSRVRTKAYPPERDVCDEPPRIGVFVCHCGSNIASVVDVERVVQRTRQLPGVVLAETNVYTCADDNQDRMKVKIAEHRLNRVVVASCTPRTHEPIFRDTLRDAGLNPYLLEMANIRDQCSWVHSGNPAAATEKAIDLVRMATARAAALGALAGSDRAGEQRGPGGRRRHCRHDGRPGPGRARLSRPPGREERPPGRHELPDPPHAGRPRRPGAAGRDHRAHEDPSADHRPLAVARCEGRRARGRIHFPDRQRPGDQRDPSRRGRRGDRRHGAEARHVQLWQERAGVDAVGAVRSAGARPDFASEAGHRGDDPMRRAARRKAAVLQPRLLHDGGEECPGVEAPLAGRPDRRLLPRHADLRVPRGGLPRGAGEGRAVHPLRARAAAAVARRRRETASDRRGSRRWAATWSWSRTSSSWPRRRCRGPIAASCPNCCGCR